MNISILLLATILTSHVATSARNPGLKLKLSQRGLDYAAKVAVDKLSDYLRSTSLPKISSNSDGIGYELSKIRLRHITNAGSSVTTDARSGITVTLRNIEVFLDGNWRFDWKIWSTKMTDSGSFDLTASDATIRFTFDMSVDGAGRPTMWVKSVNSQIGELESRFRGGYSAVHNLFSGYVNWKVRNALPAVINNALKVLVNEEVRKYLQTLTVQFTVSDLVTLDYRLVAAPEIKPNYVESSHRGEFFWTTNITGTPFLPPPIADFPETTKMTTLCLSDYVSNSLGHVFYTHGRKYLRYTFNESDLPSNIRDILMFNSYLQIGEGGSSDGLKIVVYATEAPTLRTTNNGITGYLYGNIEIKITLPTGEVVTSLTLDAKAEVTIIAEVIDEKITGRVQDFRLNSNVTSPQVSPIAAAQINSLVGMASQHLIVPKLNDIGKTGYPLPFLDYVKYVDPELHLLEDTVCITSDVKYYK